MFASDTKEKRCGCLFFFNMTVFNWTFYYFFSYNLNLFIYFKSEDNKTFAKLTQR